MLLAFKLAFRNLMGAGLRTWLNVIVLSFSFVVIIWIKGVLAGWDLQAKNDMTNWEIAGGQYWHEEFDPFDPFSFADSHAPVPPEFNKEITAGDMEPYLIIQGSVYPQGRLQPVAIKGINPGQTLFMLPTDRLDTLMSDAIPAVIGTLMSKTLKMGPGDRVVLQWRDANGTFDAAELLIVDMFNVAVPAVDAGQIYIPLEKLREMTGMHNEATLFSFRDSEKERPAVNGWVHKSKEDLTKQVDDLIKVKTGGTSVLYAILLLLAMLAIFDTMVLSIFRRQKEIGTYVALGYTRKQVVGLFTTEGAMYAILAALLAAAYGMPFLLWQAKAGWTMPIDTSEFGMAIAQTLYPVYSAGLVTGTTLLVLVVTTIVSYWPSRKIAKMNPTDALRGKIQ